MKADEERDIFEDFHGFVNRAKTEIIPSLTKFFKKVKKVDLRAAGSDVEETLETAAEIKDLSMEMGTEIVVALEKLLDIVARMSKRLEDTFK